jgi:hypothetical protein
MSDLTPEMLMLVRRIDQLENMNKELVKQNDLLKIKNRQMKTLCDITQKRSSKAEAALRAVAKECRAEEDIKRKYTHINAEKESYALLSRMDRDECSLMKTTHEAWNEFAGKEKV